MLFLNPWLIIKMWLILVSFIDTTFEDELILWFFFYFELVPFPFSFGTSVHVILIDEMIFPSLFFDVIWCLLKYFLSSYKFYCPSVTTSVSSFSLNLFFILFFEILHSSDNLQTEKKHFLFAIKSTKWTQNGAFLSFHKTLALPFAGSNPKWKTLRFSIFLCKSNIWENSGSQVTCQNAFDQSDCNIFDPRYDPQYLYILLSHESIPVIFCMEMFAKER